MAESNSKKLNKFKVKRHLIHLKIIEMCVKQSFNMSLNANQTTQIDNQIKKLGKKKELYDRKIKAMEEVIYETR